MKTKEKINNILTDLVFEIAPAGHYELKEYTDRIVNLLSQQRQEEIEISEADTLDDGSGGFKWYVCPSCEKRLVAGDDRFCPYCGKKLKWKTQTKHN